MSETSTLSGSSDLAILIQDDLASAKALDHLMGNSHRPVLLLAVELLLDAHLPAHVHHRLDVLGSGEAPDFRAYNSLEHCLKVLVHDYCAAEATCRRTG